MTAIDITDYDIQAFVDGEVPEKDHSAMLKAIVGDAALYNRYLLYKKQKNLLKSMWKDH
jgi:anti-sigma factor RsiW